MLAILPMFALLALAASDKGRRKRSTPMQWPSWLKPDEIEDPFASSPIPVVPVAPPQNLAPPSSVPAPSSEPLNLAPAPSSVAPSSAPDVEGGIRNSHLLRSYLMQNPTRAAWGLESTRATPIANYQRAMGIPVTGAVDARTRQTAEGFGVRLPSEPSALRPVPKPVPPPVPPPVPKPVPPPVPKPAPARPSKGEAVDAQRTAQTKAAHLLRLVLIQTGAPAFGTKAAPSNAVLHFQRTVPALKKDGILGPKTYAAAKALGVKLPPRPTATAITPFSQMTPGQRKAAKAYDDAARKAANLLKTFLVRNKNSVAAFGTRASPSKQVRGFQAAARIATDGIMGPQTYAAAKRLGVTLPPRPAAPAVASPSVRQGAIMLRSYLQQHRNEPAAWGFKGKPSKPVANFQRLARITQDGIYGPNTRAAGKRAGVEMPARPR